MVWAPPSGPASVSSLRSPTISSTTAGRVAVGHRDRLAIDVAAATASVQLISVDPCIDAAWRATLAVTEPWARRDDRGAAFESNRFPRGPT